MGINLIYLIKMKVLLLIATILSVVSSYEVMKVAPSKKLNMILGGVYMNMNYNLKGMNNWHWVELKSFRNAELTWTNKAGVKWNMKVLKTPCTKTHHRIRLACGKNPYYNKGFKFAFISMDKRGAYFYPTRIWGPGREPYLRINNKL